MSDRNANDYTRGFDDGRAAAEQEVARLREQVKAEQRQHIEGIAAYKQRVKELTEEIRWLRWELQGQQMFGGG